jgi:putative transposase
MTFRRFAADYYEQHRTTWIQMREGEKALKDKLLPYIERDINRLEVGDVFVADGKTTTFNIINPYTGHAQKATLIGHLDWKSKDLAGWELMLTENVQAIASSLRNGIMRLGRTCKITYQDNGKAFKARFFQNSPSFEECGFYGVFGRLSITPVFSMPYNARAKVIERFWREFVEGGEKLVPSFTGTSPTDKAAYVMRNEKFHKQLHEEKYGVDGVAITLDEAKYFIDNWLSFYRSLESPHVSGKAIGEVFNEARIIDNPIQEKLLDDLMMQLEDKDYKIGRNGVNILNSHYYAPELTHIVGDDVRVKVSIFDYSYVKVFTCDGRFVCRAERVEKTHPMAFHLGNAKDQQDFKERLKIQQRAKKEVMHNTAIQMRYLQGAANMIADGTYGVPLKSIEQPLQLVESAPEAPESDESFINPYEG